MARKQLEWASEQQRRFVLAGAHPTLFLGGYGSAKTFGACMKLLRLVTAYPGSRWAVVRRVHKQLKATTMVTFDNLVDGPMLSSRNDTDGTRVFTNGAVVQFLGLDTPGSLGVLQGLEINGAFVDQAEEISEKTWDTIDARVGRWTKLDKMPARWLFATANPTDELHWLYERFADESPRRATWAERGYECIVADSRSNKFLPEANLEALMAKDDEFQRRFVRGEWGNPEGRIFTLDPLSILEPTPDLIAKIQNTMHLHRSLDHGDSAPTACLWHATDGDGNIFVFREYYVPEKLVSDHRRAIAVMSGKEIYRSQYADPSIFHKTAQKYGGRWSIADEYADTQVMPANTALYWSPADNSEMPSRSRIKEYLRVDPEHVHPITREKGAPRLFFVRKGEGYSNGCDRVITELKAQKRVKIEEAGGRDVYSDDRDDTVPDHAYDALKYFVISRPAVMREAAQAPGPLTWQGYSNMMRRRNERRRGMKVKEGWY
jgi:PBSX family phage terminase large subunit